MNAKKGITIVLLLFVVIAVGTLVIKGVAQEQQTNSADKKETGGQAQPDKTTPVQVSQDADKIPKPDADIDIAYYFMTTQRCPSCMKIEAFTKEAVEKNFTRQLESKKLLWRMVNVDQPQNIHFIQDYQLFTKSVVLVKIRGGKQVDWKYLDQVWNLLGDKKVFQDYITSEVSTFLKEKS